LIEISQVERGLDCNCFCPGCGRPLIARKGSKTIHHFAHDKSADCKGALETALHIAAKDILEKHRKIKLPAITSSTGIGWDVGSIYELYEEQTIYFDKVYLERRLDEIVPDVIVEFNNTPLFIEVAVTHFIDEGKKEKIRKLNISTLEIDISYLKGLPITFEELECAIIESPSNKKWVHNRKKELFRNKIKKLGKEHKVIYRGLSKHIDNCPKQARIWKGIPYANLTDDCFNCKYWVDFRSDEMEQYKYLTCAGEAKEQIDEITKGYKKV